MNQPLDYSKELHHILLCVADGDQPFYMTEDLSAGLLTLRAHGLVDWDCGMYVVTADGHGYLDCWDSWHPEILLEGGSANAA